MRALLQQTTAGPADLRLVDDATMPVPGPDEVLVRVEAAGVNFADVMQTRGTYGGGPTAPYAAGFELAGTVVGGPADLDGRIVLATAPGAFAQFAAVPAASLVPVPDGWSAAQALGLVLNWATALAALRLGRMSAGETVLVHAAAGGVGSAALTLARHAGARVVAAASPAKHAVVTALGASAVVDGRSPTLVDDVREHVPGVDVVLESVGRTTMPASLTLTRPYTGRVVVFGNAAGVATVTTDDLVFRHPVQVVGLHIGSFAEHRPADYASVLDELGELAAAGVVPPGTPELHPLRDGARVLADLESGSTVGKHALLPWA